MPLLECSHVEGTETVIEQDPAILTLPEVVYIPINTIGAGIGAIYDHGGRLIPASAYFRGYGSGALGNELIAPLRYGDVAARAPDELYIYGGFIHGHYGHFLLSTLSRYWCFHKIYSKNIKIIYHAAEDIVDLFRKPFIATLFGALGLGPEDFVSFTEPTQVRRLVIPAPGFEETGFAYRTFSTFGRTLGEMLTKSEPAERSDVPVYLSKARLPHGVGHLVNEEDFTDVLSGYGVEVVYPEQLNLVQQIALFRNRPMVAGLTGSAMHTGIFACGHTAVGMSYGDTIYSSYRLIDRISDVQGLYCHPQDDIELLPRSAEFHLDYRLTDARRTAEQFLRLLESAAKSTTRRTALRSSSGKIKDPFSWPNVARRKPTRQSSFGPREVLDTPAGYRSTATSGLLTGRYQFHTDHEDQPWWDVDLLDRHQVFEIHLHNRSDNSQERASQFVISMSQDDVDWRELHRQDVPLVFGNGLQDQAFVWKAQAPVEARLIRITLSGTNFFHLDQVEIFGRSLSTGPQPSLADRSRLSRPRF